MAEIKIHISKKTGQIKILDAGGGGSSCLVRTAELEKRIGQAMEETRVLTEEFFDEPDNVLTIEEDGQA
jgi:hypothetical protein